MNDNITLIIVVVVVVVVVDFITLLSIYMVGNHRLSKTVRGVTLSQGKEIHPTP
jgi:hypothetical protein